MEGKKAIPLTKKVWLKQKRFKYNWFFWETNFWICSNKKMVKGKNNLDVTRFEISFRID